MASAHHWEQRRKQAVLQKKVVAERMSAYREDAKLMAQAQILEKLKHTHPGEHFKLTHAMHGSGSGNDVLQRSSVKELQDRMAHDESFRKRLEQARMDDDAIFNSRPI